MAAPLLAEFAPPLFVTAPILESLAFAVEQVQPAPVVEYETLAPVVMYEHAPLPSMQTCPRFSRTPLACSPHHEVRDSTMVFLPMVMELTLVWTGR